MIRILVAEDFELIREDLCDVLNQQEDITVVGSAGSGKEIEALAMDTDFDIVLMDIEMETTNAGIHATEHILEKKPEVKVLFLTAHETDNMILTSMGAGAVDYIVKGCEDEELLQHIRSAYAGQPMLDGKIQNLLLKEYSRLRTRSIPACAPRSAPCSSSSARSPSSPPQSGTWCGCCWRARRSRRSPPSGAWRWSPSRPRSRACCASLAVPAPRRSWIPSGI